MRLFVDDELNAGAEISLSAAQAHYLRDVMRQREGDALALFNGRDGEWAAEIVQLAKKKAVLRVSRKLREQTQSPDLWLIFAPVKRSPIDLIAQKATELGVARLQPALTERTVASRVNVERLSAIAIEAAEQSERMTAPEVCQPVKLDVLIDQWPEGRRLMYCDEAGDDPSRPWGGETGRAAPALEALAPFAGEDAGPWAILTGPEGGFSMAERTRLRGLDFSVPVTLGPRILRADTAVIAAIALWQAALGDWR